MDTQKLEKLSRLLTSFIEGSNHLKNEIRRLQEKVEELDREKQVAQEQNQQFASELEKLHALENSNRKMTEDQTVVRSKVQNILENLEKMDIV